MTLDRRALLSTAAAAAALAAAPAIAATAAEIDTRVRLAVEALQAKVPGGRELYAQARGALVLPNVIKGGFVLGGAYGEGALLIEGQTAGYYALAAASVGFQAGVQRSTQVVLFMTDAALENFRRAQGWQAGVDAELTVLDTGIAAGVGTATAAAPVIAIVFGQDGLLAGASIQGAKISPIAR